MKKIIDNISKKLNLEIIEYETYRSDFNCQVYNIQFYDGENIITFSDSYIVEEKGDKEMMLQRLEEVLTPKIE